MKVTVDIDHTYRGDLIVTLKPPAAMGAAAVVLHNRAGGSADNIKMTYAASNVPALVALNGKSPAGTWTLLVEDKARFDAGTLRGFSLEMQF